MIVNYINILLLGHCDDMTHLLCSSLITIPSGQPHPSIHTFGQGEATPMFEQVVGHSGAQSMNTCPSYGHSVHTKMRAWNYLAACMHDYY